MNENIMDLMLGKAVMVRTGYDDMMLVMGILSLAEENGMPVGFIANPRVYTYKLKLNEKGVPVGKDMFLKEIQGTPNRFYLKQDFDIWLIDAAIETALMDLYARVTAPKPAGK